MLTRRRIEDIFCITGFHSSYITFIFLLLSLNTIYNRRFSIFLHRTKTKTHFVARRKNKNNVSLIVVWSNLYRYSVKYIILCKCVLCSSSALRKGKVVSKRQRSFTIVVRSSYVMW